MKVEKLSSGIRALTLEETEMVSFGINDMSSPWWQLDGTCPNPNAPNEDGKSETGGTSKTPTSELSLGLAPNKSL